MKTFIARQPIFNREKRVMGYELLFRDSVENFFPECASDVASASVIASSSMVFGLDALTHGKPAFINATKKLLVGESFGMLPASMTVVEVLETVEADEEVVEACRRLKEEGYQIALDDFVYRKDLIPLLKLANVVKVDFKATDLQTCYRLAKKLRRLKITMLAEKIETYKHFGVAKEMGYDLFQGYFFARPEIIAGSDVPGFKLNYVQLLQEIHQPDLDVGRLEEILKRDVALSYKLLRYINSAHFGMRVRVSSIRHAMNLLGAGEVKKWATLVLMSNLGEDKPQQLLVQAVFRARFLESLAPLIELEKRREDLFLMGMFSLIDGVMDQPLDAILDDIPIAEDVKLALTGQRGRLRSVMDACRFYERGRWKEFSRLAGRLAVSEEEVSQLYVEATEWAHQGVEEL
jgi:c-di-GMP-related signal transduction protein